jgi:hypothetical protein
MIRELSSAFGMAAKPCCNSEPLKSGLFKTKAI